MFRKKLAQWMAVILTVTTVFTQAGVPVMAAETAPGQETVQEMTEEIPQDDPAPENGELEDGSSVQAATETDGATEQEDTDAQAEETPAVPEDERPVAGADDDLPYGIKGMPEGYELTEEEIRIKENAVSHDIVGTLQDYTAGVDYEENTVVCLADSEEHAQLIADAYGGELVEYSYGVATISLADTDLTVEQALEAGSDMTTALPLVEPNYIHYYEDPQPDEDLQIPEVIHAYSDVATPITWMDVTDPEGDGKFRFNDPALQPTFEKYQWMHEMINSYAAWGVTTGDPDITVAVIDTGVLQDHEDLNGRVNSVSVKTGTTDLGTDPVAEHGTHVAGIIAAAARNGKGGAGVAPGVSILSICVEYNNMNGGPLTGGMPGDAIMRAINYVAGYDENSAQAGDRRADIINMSLGGPIYNAQQEECVRRAYEAGVTVCVAMGNEQANNMAYPAAYDHVIAVASVNESGEKSNFSTWGSWADVAAPGHHIYSTVIASTEDAAGNVTATDLSVKNKYESLNGTSMATPVVAGACALYMSAVGHVDPDTMERVIRASVNKSFSKDIGTGIIDVSKMFSVDKTAPEIDLVTTAEKVLATAMDGNTENVKETIPSNARVYIARAPFDGNGYYQGNNDSGNKKREKLIYTTDGKAPAILNGEVISGEVYSGAINVSDLLAGSTAKKKITIKAACVTGMGVMGKITTMSFTADPGLTEYGKTLVTDLVITNHNIELQAGKSITLKAVVTPETAPQKVTWRIKGYSDGDLSKAKIGAATGTVTTDPKQTGTLVVECISEDGNQRDSATIKVINEIKTVNKFTLEKDKATIYYSNKTGVDQNILSGLNTVTVSVSTLEDAKGADLTGKTAIQWSSSNNKIATVDGTASDNTKVKIVAAGKGTATITGMAMDGSGKKATVSVTVNQDVESIAVSGQTYIVKGTNDVKVTYKATVLPATANQKAVTWSINGTLPVGVTFDPQKGQVTVAPNAVNGGTFQVMATAKDGSDINGLCQVTIAGAKADSVGIETSANANLYQLKRNATTGVLTGARLFTKNVGNNVPDEHKIILKGQINRTDATAENLLTWSSSNPKIATVMTADGGITAQVEAVGKGTAMITCVAQDGSGKKASVSISVAVPVEKVTVSGQSYIEKGNSAGFKAAVLPATANVKTVEWSIEGSPSDVTIDPKTGKVTVAANATLTTFTVVAKATDGSSEKGTLPVKVSSAKTNSVVIGTSEVASVYQIKRNAVTGNLTGIRLFTEKTGDDSKDETCFPLLAFVNDGSAPQNDLLTWTSSNSKIVNVIPGDNGKTATVHSVGKGTATITCAAQDGSGKKASITVKVDVPVKEIRITGQGYIMRDASATFKASAVLPVDATDKKVDWSVTPNDGKVTITSTGMVKVDKNAPVGESYSVHATAKDGSKASSAAVFEVVAQKATVVSITADSAYLNKSAYKVQKKNNSGELISVQLFTVNAVTGDDDETEIPVHVQTDNGTKVAWSSSNTGIAEVVSISGTGAAIKARGAGTATITCAAQDGSNKKASFKVNVIVPVSSLTLVPKGSQTKYIGYGKSATLNPVLGQLYGKPGNSKLQWKITKVQIPISKTQAKVYSPGATLSKLATVSNGRVTAPANGWGYAYERLGMYEESLSYKIFVEASTTDGTGLTAQYEYDTYFPFTQLSVTGSTVVPYGVKSRVVNVSGTVSGISYGWMVKVTRVTPGALDVQSSNPKVISAEYLGRGRIRLVPRELGTANITITTTDGSNKKLTFKASHQKGLVNSIIVSGASTVNRGSSETYTATVEPDDARDKTVKWSLDSANGSDAELNDIQQGNVRIDGNTGVVTVSANASAGCKYTIYADAVDAGKEYGSTTFTVSDP